ncbi:hypothetical protein [Pontibacter sp. G13]|nr:hypothetical protein [Pontibacter sp. G13]WNJ19094.1 hypothetical protein RJD25_01270 [Pontibacter sp. G13]
MTRQRITYFDRSGAPTVDRNGVASSVYNYDEEGKYLGKTDYDLAHTVIE